MKRVWKCDYCYHFETSIEKMKTHEEEECSSNPKFKKCSSCCNLTYIYDSPDCKKDLDYWEMDDVGNCIGWETDDKKLLRKIKLEQINSIK